MITPQHDHRPLVLGHRGASAHAGDNTIEAFELAVAQGADGVELEIRDVRAIGADLRIVASPTTVAGARP